MSRHGSSGKPPGNDCPSNPPPSRSDPKYMERRAAVQLPNTDEAWNSPSMNGRELSGTVSARSVTAAAKTPPTPRPVSNRYR